MENGDVPTSSQSNVAKLREQLDKLVRKGEHLRVALAVDLDKISQDDKEAVKKLKLPSFKSEYEAWYSLAMRVVKQLIPDRLPDFVHQYKVEKRKEIDFLTYGISDYMIGLTTKRYQEIVADGNAPHTSRFQASTSSVRRSHSLESPSLNSTRGAILSICVDQGNFRDSNWRGTSATRCVLRRTDTGRAASLR